MLHQIFSADSSLQNQLLELFSEFNDTTTKMPLKIIYYGKQSVGDKHILLFQNVLFISAKFNLSSANCVKVENDCYQLHFSPIIHISVSTYVLTLLETTNLEAFADDKFNVAKVSVLERIENIVEKGENFGYQHFLLLPQCFPKPSRSGSLKVLIVW